MNTQTSDMIGKQEAAEIIGVSVRMISRYVALGYLRKFKDPRRHVQFSRRQCEAMNTFEPQPAKGDTLVTREQAAEAVGVTSRRITQYVADGHLTRYEDNRGRVRFSLRECGALTQFTPVG